MTENSLNIEVMQRVIGINQRLQKMCFCLLIIAPVAGKSFAGVLLNSAKRCANSGEAVKLVPSIGNQYKDVSLYNESVIMITSWKDISNEIQFIDPNYRGRIYMDEKRNIWILGVERRDTGKYFVKFGMKNETHDIELFVKEEPTEKQIQECQNNHPDSPKEFEFSDFYKDKVGFAYIYCRSSSEDNRITLILMFMIFTWLIVLLDKGRKLVMFANTQCEKKTMTDDLIKRQLYDHPDFKEKYLEKLTIDQMGEHMQKCLDIYPVLMERYLGNLTEDQIGEQIQKLLCVYPGLFMKKFLELLMEDQVKKMLSNNPDFMEKYDQNGIHPTNPPTHDELAVIPKEVANETEDNQCPLVSPKEKFISPKMCGDSGSDQNGIYPAISPTLEDLAVTPKEMANETEDNQNPLVSPQGILISPKICGDSGSDSLNVRGHSSIKPFNVDEQNEDLEGHITQTERQEFSGVSVNEDSNSEDECKEPLL